MARITCTCTPGLKKFIYCMIQSKDWLIREAVRSWYMGDPGWCLSITQYHKDLAEKMQRIKYVKLYWRIGILDTGEETRVRGIESDMRSSVAVKSDYK